MTRGHGQLYKSQAHAVSSAHCAAAHSPHQAAQVSWANGDSQKPPVATRGRRIISPVPVASALTGGFGADLHKIHTYIPVHNICVCTGVDLADCLGATIGCTLRHIAPGPARRTRRSSSSHVSRRTADRTWREASRLRDPRLEVPHVAAPSVP